MGEPALAFLPLLFVRRAPRGAAATLIRHGASPFGWQATH